MKKSNTWRIVTVLVFLVIGILCMVLDINKTVLGHHWFWYSFSMIAISLGSELAGIVIGVVVIDYLNEKRQDEQLREELKRDLTSSVRDVAVNAIDELKALGWQESVFQSEKAAGLTSLVVKPASTQVLWAAIQPTVPETETGSVLIVDDDPRARRLTQEAVSQGLLEFTVRTAVNGAEGLSAMLAQPPDLIILDLMMPEMNGFEVLEQMRADKRTRQVPVVILSSRQLSLADVKRLEQYSAVMLRSKDVFPQEEMAASVHQVLFGEEGLPPHTSALIKESVAYLHQNYKRTLTRTEIADELGMSEDYFSRAFSQELGISPWDYLNRYRVAQAKLLLQTSSDNIRKIARQVGISDPAYFSRVFSRIVGMSPSVYRRENSR